MSPSLWNDQLLILDSKLELDTVFANSDSQNRWKGKSEYFHPLPYFLGPPFPYANIHYFPTSEPTKLRKFWNFPLDFPQPVKI